VSRITRRIVLIAGLCTTVIAACDGPSSVPTAPSVAGPPSPPPTGGAIVGSYTVTLQIAPSCTVVPEADRVRRYSAQIDPARDSGRYLVTLTGSTFLSGPICTAGSGRFAGIGCNQFLASEDIDTMSVFLENNNDEAHGGHIAERTASGTWLEIIGGAGGKIGAATTELAGTASVWYCPSARDYPFPCTNSTFCTADLQISFSRVPPR
jgi:hypothetical protein